MSEAREQNAIPRYDPEIEEDYYCGKITQRATMLLNEIGDFVKVSDHDAAMQEKDKEIERLERSEDQLMTERDKAVEAADKLAYAIGTVEEIGEHTNHNDPWVQAHIVLLDKLEQLAASDAIADKLAETLKWIAEVLSREKKIRDDDKETLVEIFLKAERQSAAYNEWKGKP